jgi:hypothetical protein
MLSLLDREGYSPRARSLTRSLSRSPTPKGTPPTALRARSQLHQQTPELTDDDEQGQQEGGPGREDVDFLEEEQVQDAVWEVQNGVMELHARVREEQWKIDHWQMLAEETGRELERVEEALESFQVRLHCVVVWVRMWRQWAKGGRLHTE